MTIIGLTKHSRLLLSLRKIYVEHRGHSLCLDIVRLRSLLKGVLEGLILRDRFIDKRT